MIDRHAGVELDGAAQMRDRFVELVRLIGDDAKLVGRLDATLSAVRISWRVPAPTLGPLYGHGPTS
jgi:hypothetical protein